MTGRDVDRKSEMLASVMEFVEERAPADELPALSTFAEMYIRRFPEDAGAQLTPEECFGQVEDLYEFIKVRPPGTRTVRVFTPNLEKNGYETGASVVEVVVDDSPFLVDSVTAEIQDRGITVERALHPVIG